MKLIDIGFGNLVSAGRLIAVVSPDSAPIKRMVQEARDRGQLVDATYGRKTQAVLILDNDHLVLSALTPDVISGCLGRTERRNHAETEREGPAHRALRPFRCG